MEFDNNFLNIRVWQSPQIKNQNKMKTATTTLKTLPIHLMEATKAATTSL